MSDLREKIIKSSLQLFSDKGFHGVTVNDIVNHCDTSKGGFYHHFKSKDELLYVIHDTFISYVLNEANQAKKCYDRPIFQLHEMLKALVRVYDLYNEHIVVFNQENKYLKENYEILIQKKRDNYKEILQEVIKQGQELGEIRNELPTTITNMAILGMVNWTYQWYKKDGPKTIDEIASTYIDIIFSGLLTTEALEEYRASKLSMTDI
ncbi:TetR/AcrR family transcriptional regulator [Filobacillus milosensis]|uniref:TetR/AcrR family transcriptional regulator n=1 Tax=Filobacillus milosensis TaxID=94137 RepID=A0A4Y8IAU0_9BACI|nr:TetR/AcrR family transcriptional regulator [Filobacillus milosensis]TFB13070.1 TetR/AcrR family transcriptional regulator [Filobacillus milosensis]